MKIKIFRAGQPSYWYSGHIGEEFEVKASQVFKESKGGIYWITTGTFEGYGVYACDAEIVEHHYNIDNEATQELKAWCLHKLKHTNEIH